MDMELDIDGLHNALEASPNDQQALETLVSFYRSEGAFEELTELYLGQLENQTEQRLPLYQGLAEVMEKHLSLPDDARVVVLEGLQEFSTDKTLWSQLRDLSETEEQLLEYVTMLKEIGLTENVPALIPELILLIGELSEAEIALVFERVYQISVETRDDSTMLNLWHELNEQCPDQRHTYLPNMLDVAIELSSTKALELAGAELEEVHDDFVAQFISAIRNLTIKDADVAISIMLKPALASTRNETKTMAMSAIMDIAEALNDLALVDQLDISDEAVSDDVFERFIKLTLDECTAKKELSPLLRQLPNSQAWTDARRDSLLSTVMTLIVELQELSPLLDLWSNIENASQPILQLFQSSVKSLCTLPMSEPQFDTLVSVIEAW
ncbi:MAG: tetratricopeptide repeat protein, partial [Bradymonadia bacterium]